MTQIEQNYFNKLSEVLEELFPKKKCKERSQALVLNAQANLFMREALKEQREEIIEEVKRAIEDEINSMGNGLMSIEKDIYDNVILNLKELK